ncbi:MAG TPA: protein kinase, partial [Gemmataceae bacterium]
MSDPPAPTPLSGVDEGRPSPVTQQGTLSQAPVLEKPTIIATVAFVPSGEVESETPSLSSKQTLPAIPGYEVLGVLGRGGMGVVYKARQIKANRLVALKMILAGSYADEDQLERFRSEAEAIARLQHPHIVQVFDVGEHEEQPFFSLEFCGGGSLSRHLHGTPLPPREAARLVEVLAEAIHAAHQKGVIHRDLKPANVLLQRDEADADLTASMLKITDFGLAKKVEDAGQTATGVVMGTPSYMAPEQTSGDSRRIGPAVDIYALGAILYELLTGRPPFHGATPVETILQVQHNEPVPPRQLQPRTPRDVETICLKCLHKDASRRYATAADLAADLGRFLRDEPIEARPVGWTERAAKWVHRRPAAASLLAVAVATPLIALSLAGWYLNRKEQFNAQLSEINKRLETERNTALEKKELAERSEAKANQREIEANEQKKLAQEATRDSQLRLTQMHVATGVRLMEDGDALTALPWLAAALKEDPSAAATREMHRYRIGALLRQSPRIVRLFFLRPYVIGAEFSPDGRQLLAASSDGTARVWNIATGKEFPPPPRQRPSLSSAVFSPDGRLAVTADRDRYAKVWEAATGQVVATLEHDQGVNWACFSPDGRHVLTASNDKTARIWDAQTGQPLGQPLRHGDRVLHAAFCPDGRLVATASSNTARIWDALTGKLLVPGLQHNGEILHVAFSPDGKRIVSASRDNRVRVWDVATGKLVFTFSHNNVVFKAFFSPDGGRIVSCSLDFTARLWDAATGRPIGQPLKHGAAVSHASFSPDGSRV